jgi:hypothetical protein
MYYHEFDLPSGLSLTVNKALLGNPSSLLFNPDFQMFPDQAGYPVLSDGHWLLFGRGFHLTPKQAKPGHVGLQSLLAAAKKKTSTSEREDGWRYDFYNKILHDSSMEGFQLPDFRQVLPQAGPYVELPLMGSACSLHLPNVIWLRVGAMATTYHFLHGSSQVEVGDSCRLEKDRLACLSLHFVLGLAKMGIRFMVPQVAWVDQAPGEARASTGDPVLLVTPDATEACGILMPCRGYEDETFFQFMEGEPER